MSFDLPFRAGATGDAVRDVQRRLLALGFDVDDALGTYGSSTEAAVARFQTARGLRADGVCGAQTWDSLVEAGYRLGDRLLYHHQPMQRGDDVQDLQQLLGALGFDAGRVDGIFGPATVAALTRFQRNAGLTTDGICGPDTVAALHRFAREAGGPVMTIAAVREQEKLRDAPRRLKGRLLAVGETGGLAALATALGRALVDAGAVVTVLHHPDQSTQASEANAFQAEAFVSLAARGEAGLAAAYYEAPGFVSFGGRRLAELIIEEAQTHDELTPVAAAKGMRVPLLRETRMPAVIIEAGPPGSLVEHTPELVTALQRALHQWVEVPFDT